VKWWIIFYFRVAEKNDRSVWIENIFNMINFSHILQNVSKAVIEGFDKE